MELAVHIAGAGDLAGDLKAPLFPDARPTHAAFGTEFCEHLIPAREALVAAAEAARSRGLRFTFLTPYVSDAGIGRLRGLLPVLNPGDEVVFSDWGVLRLLRREFPHLVPIQGRLLYKALRDPRIMGVYASAPAQTVSLNALQRSNLDNESYTDFLASLGVAGIELDALPQGTDLSFAGRGLGVAVYFPYGFIATGRVCMAAGLHYRKPDKFTPGAPCRHECQTHLVEFTYTNSPFANRDQKFLLKGNTYFYRHTDLMLRTLAEQAAAGRVTRVVYQSALPMFAAA